MQGNDLIRDRARAARPWEKTGGWSRRERLRVLWYRLRLTVREMNYATRRLVELQAGSAGLGRQGSRGRRRGRRRRNLSRARALVE